MQTVRLIETKDRRQLHVGSYFVDLNESEYQALIDMFSQGWIAIKDKLPELEQSVLLFDDWKTNEGEQRKDIRIGYLSRYSTYKTMEGETKSCEWGGSEFAFNITHWMPLPKTPVIE